MAGRNLDVPLVVTGASGFIAGHLVRLLLERGHRVRGTLRSLAREAEVRAALDPEGNAGARLELFEADLTRDEGWAEVVEGASGVFHVASPVPRRPPEHEDELIIPAREGTLRVLRAARAAGIVRVVMTSSIAAVSSGHAPREAPFTERDWSLVDGLEPYDKSKALAERAAWDYVQSPPRGPELVTINPSFVLGPLLWRDHSTSLEIVRKLIMREVPGIPDLYFPLVDVRDVAEAHYRAMRLREVKGRRIICSADTLSMKSIASLLRHGLRKDGFKIPRRPVPNWMVRLYAIFDPTTRLVVHRLGERKRFDIRPLRDLLEVYPRNLELTLVDTARSLVRHGVVPAPRRPRKKGHGHASRHSRPH